MAERRRWNFKLGISSGRTGQAEREREEENFSELGGVLNLVALCRDLAWRPQKSFLFLVS